MERRKFMKDVALGSAALAASVPAFTLGRPAWAAGPAVVGHAEGTDWPGLVAKVLEPLGGMKAFVKAGAKVFIKPNASFDRTPEQAANTHPEILKAVIKECLAAGAGSVMVFDRTLAEERRCYVNSGIGPMIEGLADAKVILAGSDDRKYVPIKIDRGIAFNKWDFHKDALDAEVYINVPIAKHHGTAKLTLGLKNILGIIGGNRGKIHWSLDQGIVDLNTARKTDLTIIDATRVLLNNGPSGGDQADVAVKNTLIASADIVAADSWAAKVLFGADPQELGYLPIANKAGLGEMDLSKIKIEKV